MIEFRYFLPRYFELIAANMDADLYPDHWSSPLYRLAATKWRRDWPEIEVRVIDEFFAALLQDVVSDLQVTYYRPTAREDGPARWRLQRDIDKVLVLVEDAGGNVTAMFDQDYSAEHFAKSVHVANYCMEYLRGDSPTPDWLIQPHISANLESAFFATEDACLQNILSNGQDAIDRLLAKQGCFFRND